MSDAFSDIDEGCGGSSCAYGGLQASGRSQLRDGDSWHGACDGNREHSPGAASSSRRLSGAAIIVNTLIAHGVDTVFGFPGGAVLGLYDELYRHTDRITHYLTSHEQGAAHAADGYARASGKCGVVIATSGPGATNLVTGIAAAYLDSVPLIAITGNVAAHLMGKDSFQEVDITGITMPITKHNYLVKRVDDLEHVLYEAFQVARSGRPGPVLIDIPKNVQQEEAEFAPGAPFELFGAAMPSEEHLARAAELINQSERPYIYGGGGVISANAAQLLREFVRKIDAPVGLSMMGLGAMDASDPLFLGMTGMHGSRESISMNAEADLIIGIGVRFSDRATGDISRYRANTKVLHIDIDDAEIDKNVKSTASLLGDLREILPALADKVEPRDRSVWKRRAKELKKALSAEALGAERAWGDGYGEIADEGLAGGEGDELAGGGHGGPADGGHGGPADGGHGGPADGGHDALVGGEGDELAGGEGGKSVDEGLAGDGHGAPAADPSAAPFTPSAVIKAVRKYTTDDTVVATDVGQHQMWVAQHYGFSRPRTFLTSGGLGAMGFGLGAAIGASLACGDGAVHDAALACGSNKAHTSSGQPAHKSTEQPPHKKARPARTVLFTSDGSFHMNMAELATAVHYKTPIVVVVLNNHALGMVRQWQNHFYGKRYFETTLERATDFVALAKAFGAEGFRPQNDAELNEALEHAFGECAGVVVIDCRIDADAKVFPIVPPDGFFDDAILDEL